MSNIVILGYGNPLRGDDAIGWLAAQQLQERFPASDVTVIAAHQLNPEHAELVANADLAIFVDASAEGPAGTITQISVLPAEHAVRPSTHSLSPEGLLAYARALYGSYPEAVLFAVGAGGFESCGMSEPVSRAMPLLLDEISAICGNAQVGTGVSPPLPSGAR